MLIRIRLQNFRGFHDQTIPLRSLTVAVGQNNAGKSTLVEALRILSIVTRRYRNLPYQEPPDWLPLPRRMRGTAPALKRSEVQFDTIFHRYSEPPATITADFAAGQKVTIYIGAEGKVHAVIQDSAGDIVRSKSDAQSIDLPSVAALPQVGPVQDDEAKLSDDYVRSSLSSALASRHFRNQLLLLEEYFDAFRHAAEENWPGLQIRDLGTEGPISDRYVYLHVRNEDFVGELGLMGHGLQLWLQTIWFLTRSRDAGTIILDEPDVYMHPDLQRRLVRHLASRDQQLVLTTHSVEIMSEVSPTDILIVDRHTRTSGFADSLDSVQKTLSGLGSAHNIHLARLWSTRRFLLVEGKDVEILKEIHDLLYPQSESLKALPNMEIGGWSGWPYAVGSSMTFKNAMGQDVITYCVLDSDYHTEERIATRYEEAQRRGVELHIWQYKEIENYLLSANAIARLIARRSRKGQNPSSEQVSTAITEIADSLADDIVDNLADEIRQENRASGHKNANQKARHKVKEHRDTNGSIVGLASGKEIFSRLSKWASDHYNVSFSVKGALAELRKADVPDELAGVVDAIEGSRRFENSS